MSTSSPDSKPDDVDRQRKLVARVIAGRAFTIKTPPAEVLFAMLCEWLTVGFLGGLVVGPPRLGKTQGTRWVLGKLHVLFGQRIPWAEIPVRDDLLASAGGFFQHILRRMGDANARRGTVADRRDRLTERLITWAQKSPIRTVILYFDESQQLTIQHYKWLLNIANELDPLGYRVFCLMVGQRTLLTKKAEFMEMPEMDQIVGRFMVGELEYDAIRTEQELSICLNEMDLAVPRGSDLPFVANFAPLAHTAGWRLSAASSEFWHELKTSWISVRTDSVSIPMQYLCSSVALYLQSMSHLDAGDLAHSAEAIQKAVARSGFKSAVPNYFRALPRHTNKNGR